MLVKRPAENQSGGREHSFRSDQCIATNSRIGDDPGLRQDPTRRFELADELSRLHQQQKELLQAGGGFVHVHDVAQRFVLLQKQIDRIQRELTRL